MPAWWTPTGLVGDAGVDADDWSMGQIVRVREIIIVALPLSVIPHVLSLLIWPSGQLHRSHQTWAKTLRHLGRDSSALGARQFGCTSADLSGQFGPTRLVRKCPGSEVSVIRLKSNGTDDGTLSRPRICKPLYGRSQGDEIGD